MLANNLLYIWKQFRTVLIEQATWTWYTRVRSWNLVLILENKDWTYSRLQHCRVKQFEKFALLDKLSVFFLLAADHNTKKLKLRAQVNKMILDGLHKPPLLDACVYGFERSILIPTSSIFADEACMLKMIVLNQISKSLFAF